MHKVGSALPDSSSLSLEARPSVLLLVVWSRLMWLPVGPLQKGHGLPRAFRGCPHGEICRNRRRHFEPFDAFAVVCPLVCSLVCERFSIVSRGCRLLLCPLHLSFGARLGLRSVPTGQIV